MQEQTPFDPSCVPFRHGGDAKLDEAAEQLNDLFTAQTLSYLRATQLKAALLINFNVPLLKHGIRRYIL